eukprot:scaffold161830_cov40-Tisochrysis_lutea.AAC.1
MHPSHDFGPADHHGINHQVEGAGELGNHDDCNQRSQPERDAQRPAPRAHTLGLHFVFSERLAGQRAAHARLGVEFGGVGTHRRLVRTPIGPVHRCELRSATQQRAGKRAHRASAHRAPRVRPPSSSRPRSSNSHLVKTQRL